MGEQRKFPTAFFGFSRDAVLNYIYEMDADTKQRMEQLDGENKELLSAIDTLKDKLREAVSQLEEANAQYDIVKAQYYNEKKDAEDLRSQHERLTRDAQQLASATRERENELQLQKELNKQLQGKLAETQHLLENSRAQWADRPQESKEVGEPATAVAAATASEAAEAEETQVQLTALKAELSELRDAITRKLADFGAALGAARQEASAGRGEPPRQGNSFFR